MYNPSRLGVENNQEQLFSTPKEGYTSKMSVLLDNFDTTFLIIITTWNINSIFLDILYA